MTSPVQNPAAVFPLGHGRIWGNPPERRERTMARRRKITLRNRIRLARLEHAITRLESAVMIAFTII